MTLNEQPLVAQFQSLIDQDRIDQLLALDFYQPSQGYSHGESANILARDRTSLSLFDYSDSLRDIRQAMIDRIREETGRDHPLENCELLQLTRYRQDQQYEPHWDHFNITGYENTVEVDRIATALLYLNDGFEGGTTDFPSFNLRVQPIQGDILYFEYPRELAHLMLHAGRPVRQGEKRIASLWIRSARWPVQD